MIVTLLIIVIALQVASLVSNAMQFRALAKVWGPLGRDIRKIIENTQPKG